MAGRHLSLRSIQQTQGAVEATMKKVTSVGTLVASLVFYSAHLAAEVVTNISEEINITVFVPCANNGVGEEVAVSGPLHTLIISNTNDNTLSGKVHFQPQGISGEGLTTGSKYQATGVTQDHFTTSLQTGQATETFVNNFRIIGQGRGNNFLVHLVSHVTFNANGDVTANHEIASTECR
jgi:hypothetical protein